MRGGAPLRRHDEARAKRVLRAGACLALALVVSVLLLVGKRARAVAPAPPPSAPDVAMAERADSVASYTLRARLDPSLHTVHGEGTIRWKNTSAAPVSELWLHLYLNAFKNQGSVFMRSAVGGFRGGGAPSDWGMIDLTTLALVGDDGARHDLLAALERSRPGDEDETDARAPLPREIASGEEVTLEVAWIAKLPSLIMRTGYAGSFHMVGQWFPKIARLEPDGRFAHFPFERLSEFYADFGRYDVTLDVPDGFVVGATGPVVETKVDGGRLVQRHVQDDVHDFAWTAWDGFVTQRERIDGVDVTVLAPRGYDDHVARELETLRFALPHLGARYGKYPYPGLTVVHPPASAPEAGGMEYPTLITTGYPTWIPRGLHLVETVTMHELAHQWFYGLVASNENAWPFLDEGLTSYAEHEAMAAWKGPGSGMDLFGLTVGAVEAQAEQARQFGHDERIAKGAGAFSTGAAYGALIYSRTATVLETLARTYGKEKMDRAMGVYARRFRFRHPVPDDFLGVIREELGGEAASNLRLALFDKGWVDYAITQVGSHPSRGAAGVFDRGGERETITRDQTLRPGQHDGYVLVVRRGTLRLPVDIELTRADGTRERVTWDGQSESHRVPYSGTSPLVAAALDPDDKLLIDARSDNDFVTVAGRPRQGAPRVFERATFWAQVLLGALAP